MYGQDALASRSPRKLRTFFAENSLVKADADRVLLGIAARRGDTKIIIGPMGRQCFELPGPAAGPGGRTRGGDSQSRPNAIPCWLRAHTEEEISNT
jgi:hypothetical protein